MSTAHFTLSDSRRKKLTWTGIRILDRQICSLSLYQLDLIFNFYKSQIRNFFTE